MLEQRALVIDSLKKDIQKKIKKISDLESKFELALQNKDKEIASLQGDMKANQDILKETILQYKSK